MIPAVILAAGLSTRMGRVKATLPIGDDHTLLTRIVSSLRAANADEIVVVLGHDADTVRQSLEPADPRPRLVVNARYREGQFSSVLAALDAIDRPGVEAMLLTLVDVPLVSPRTIAAVLARYRATGAPVVRPVNGDRHGHPVIVAASLFGALRAADPAFGAKPIVRAHVSAAGDVPVDDEGAFLDVDTPEDYARAIALHATFHGLP